MRGLARLFPGSVPEPLAVDASRRWMLLDDLGPELGWDAPVELRELVHRQFARIQVESSTCVSELLTIGCIDRRPEWLAGQIEELLADDAVLAKLEDDESERLRALQPRLVSLCRGLTAQGVPDALVHGDLHLGNVARVDDRYVVYDWTDACVTHPFFDLIDVFREQDEAVKTRVRDAYLSEWLHFAPMNRLLEIWAQAELLASLHHAVSYRHIEMSVEPGAEQEFERALPAFLRRVLAVDF
jgi:aminoglycoside phosphotransferase (APT) family kinase protein